MRSLKIFALAILLISCGAPAPKPTIAPTAAPVLASSTPTLKPIEAPAPSISTPTLRPIEPTQTIEIKPSPIASPRPTIAATPQPITITLFTIEPALIDPGDAITITWRTAGGTVNLFPINSLGHLIEPYALEASGSLIITTSPSLRSAVQYMLNVHDARLNKDIQAFASANFICPDTWFFPDGPDLCPQSPPIISPAAIQHFEHGIMIWLEARRSIYILYSDDQFSPKWTVITDIYLDTQPESDPTLIPPAGKFQPVRGFGLIWRDDHSTIGFRVRDRLGWAIDEEELFSGALQCNSAIKYITCYLKDDRGRTIELKPEQSAWNYFGP